MPKVAYENELADLQLALVRFQQAAMASGEKVVIVFEGRDAAGKDGAIKRIIEHLSIRNTRVVALPKPSDRERSQWYFQRYIAHLPAAGELVIFNRSWYNRGGVEPVMGFCTPLEHQQFLTDVPVFETMLAQSQVQLVKLWIDISKNEQAKRLDDRRTNPLKALKLSPLDAEAQARWSDYSDARDEMLTASHTVTAPWTCIRGDDKPAARINILRLLVHRLAPKSIAKQVAPPDTAVVFPFEVSALSDGRLER
ncbi:MAG: polyphosphate kinase 2 [Phenylobacterium zucineum]|nr:MAG: polyphosphate kinase 2 [Phenylobacterium zucineum]